MAHRALKAAGAAPWRKPDSPGKGDYVWGELVLTVEGGEDAPTLVGSYDDIRPGDVAQFRDAKFPRSSYSHHTAVVESFGGGLLRVLQQNVRGDKAVRRGSMRLDRLRKGWVRVYRPVAR